MHIPFRGSLIVFALASEMLCAAPSASAFDKTQWRAESKSTGTIFFYCNSRACTPGAMMSLHMKDPDIVGDLPTFERSEAVVAAQLARQGIGVAFAPATRRQLARFTEYRELRTLTYPNGKKEFYVAGLLVGHQYSLSVVSSSGNAGDARRNFDDLVDWLEHNGPPDRAPR